MRIITSEEARARACTARCPAPRHSHLTLPSPTLDIIISRQARVRACTACCPRPQRAASTTRASAGRAPRRAPTRRTPAAWPRPASCRAATRPCPPAAPGPAGRPGRAAPPSGQSTTPDVTYSNSGSSLGAARLCGTTQDESAAAYANTALEYAEILLHRTCSHKKPDQTYMFLPLVDRASVRHHAQSDA